MRRFVGLRERGRAKFVLFPPAGTAEQRFLRLDKSLWGNFIFPAKEEKRLVVGRNYRRTRKNVLKEKKKPALSLPNGASYSEKRDTSAVFQNNRPFRNGSPRNPFPRNAFRHKSNFQPAAFLVSHSLRSAFKYNFPHLIPHRKQSRG